MVSEPALDSSAPGGEVAAAEERSTEDGVVEDRVADLTFKARALAQAHPLSSVAARYRNNKIEAERQTQPLPEFADWASTAFVVGYCIRRVEEADVGAMPAFDSVAADGVDLVALDESAAGVASEVRLGKSAGIELLPAELVESLLNTVISTEIAKRAEHWKANIPDEDWQDFEGYIAWWVIHGYSLRAAETRDLQ